MRLHDGVLYSGEQQVAAGRPVDAEVVRSEMAAAQAGLTSQLGTLTHSSTEFLRREQDLLLHGLGVPEIGTSCAERIVVVATPGPTMEADLAALRGYLREQRPVLVGVGAAAEALLKAGGRLDVLILDADTGLPPRSTLLAATDVVLVHDSVGGGAETVEALERTGVRPVHLSTSATAEDAALLLAHAGDATLIVGVGLHTTLEDFLDQQRGGLASTFLTRLKVGASLVDARAVPQLYAGRVRPRHLFWVVLACLIALGAALAVTPVGQEWGETIADWISDLLTGRSSAAIIDLQGPLS